MHKAQTAKYRKTSLHLQNLPCYNKYIRLAYLEQLQCSSEKHITRLRVNPTHNLAYSLVSQMEASFFLISQVAGLYCGVQVASREQVQHGLILPDHITVFPENR